MFEINLIKDRVLPPTQRKALYWGLLVYLGLCGILLVFVVYTDTRQMIAAVNNMHEATAIRKAFKKDHPREKDMITFARALEKEIRDDIEQVGAVEDLVDQSAHLTRILLGLTVPMSREIMLDDFHLDRAARRLTFKLSVPEEDVRTAMNLIAVWNASTNLSREVRGFRVVSRDQSVQEGRPVMQVEVEGALQGKDS